MKKFLLLSVAIVATLLVAVPAATATPASSGADVEFRLKSGATWRGDVGDKVVVTYVERGVEISLPAVVTFVNASPAYISFKTEIGGREVEKTVFGSDVVSIAAPSSESGLGGEPKKGSEGRHKIEKRRRAPGTGLAGNASQRDVPTDDLGRPRGVFVLPLEGGVGQTFRHDEIKRMIEYVDENYGPGQTIVLYINSNGGLVLESLDIAKAIHEGRKRHRIVAWIDKAISAGCMTAMSCYEIYFRTGSTAGSVTTLGGGGASIQGPEVEQHVEHFVEIAEASDFSEHIARSMKLNRHQCSYDKDPETGEVTFYGDLRGEFDLSNKDQNLSFNANNALHSGFSKGTADTGEELAKLLGFDEWVELDDYGRKIATEWSKRYERLQTEFQDIQYDLQYKNQLTGDQIVILGTQKKAMQRIIRNLKRYPRITWLTFSAGQPTPEDCIVFWKEQIALIDKAISDINRR